MYLSKHRLARFIYIYFHSCSFIAVFFHFPFLNSDTHRHSLMPHTQTDSRKDFCKKEERKNNKLNDQASICCVLDSAMYIKRGKKIACKLHKALAITNSHASIQCIHKAVHACKEIIMSRLNLNSFLLCFFVGSIFYGFKQDERKKIIFLVNCFVQRSALLLSKKKIYGR